MESGFDVSRRMHEESKRVLAAGVASNLRLAMKPVPIFAERAQGSRLFDVDGNAYIDYILAYGPQILGHAHPRFVEAVRRQAERGQAFGTQHRGEIELARKIVSHVPSAELVSFCSTGSEAVHVALRLSRAFTGRRKIVKFEGQYHGWFDNVFTSSAPGGDGAVPGTAGQDPLALSELVPLPWNDVEALEACFRRYGEQLAAVITEPIMCNSGCLPPLPGYLERLRELTAAHGTVLIFDEVITGFRLGLGGAQAALGVTPDLTTLGKAVAGGMPLSAVAGRGDIMELIADNRVTHMGTLNGNPLCTAAALATIETLEEDGGAAYRRMEELTVRLTSALEEIAAREGLPFVVNRCGPVFHTMFAEERPVERYEQFVRRDAARFAALAEQLLREGVMVRPSGLWYLSAAHAEADVDDTAHRFERSVRKLKEAGGNP
ncbi:glutamate-1-semialdehyde 2,1-aminomutase [Paenibacillus sp.]|uniref:aspartate aminotransferase family protein n=1 Tax=Paenibacillus sp. TaxID=58172 RepID=UPI00281235A4|nr:glutamate-1-semialdehyde 2,1-aminomutase [Paenibacillus sp.]